MTRIDRRALFTSGAAAALLAATGVSAAASPRPGGRLRLAVPRDDGSLWAVMRGAVFDTLTEVAPDGVLRGELAESWRGSADARAWKFTLRAGVVFHDGRPLEARDVAKSLRSHAPAPLDRARIEATGPCELRIELTRGDPDLPLLFSDPALIVMPDGEIGAGADAPVGSGVYRAVRAAPDRHFLGRKVDGHYRAGQAGWADEVEVVVIPDPAVRAEALRDGFVDVAALPQRAGLLGRGEFLFHPSRDDMALAARQGIGIPRVVGTRAPLDDGRIAERWWIA